MASTMRPRGPLPARVYWTRRIVVLAVPILLVVVLARVLGGSSDGKDTKADTATRTAARVQETAPPTSGPTVGDETAGTKGGKKGKNGRKGARKRDQETTPPEPVLAEPTGPCAASDIVATPAITSAPGGSPVAIQVVLRTKVAEACTWRASPETMTVTITSGDDYIWSTRECPGGLPAQDVVVRSAVDAPVMVTWSAKRSDETCSNRTEYAYPGYYHVEAAALGGDGTDVQFELVPPQPGVITKTVEPQQGGKKKDGDTAHTPGEDGSGNSAG